jgi:hypothetical protein
MIASHKHKFIFFRVPKTGTSTIVLALSNFGILRNGNWEVDWELSRPNNCAEDERSYIKYLRKKYHLIMTPNHSECRSCSKILDKEICENYFKFAFVRNPWCRLVSRFEWQRRNHGVFELNGIEYGTFTDYIHNIDNDNFKEFVHSQYEFTKGCDFIGRFENFQEDFNVVCDKIGIPHKKLPHTNKTKHKHFTEYYDDETKQIVAEKYAKDIEHFGYEFGE